MWEFFTEPEFQEKLDWMAAFVRDECEPLDLLFPRPGDPFDMHNKASRRAPSSPRCGRRSGSRACGPATSAPSWAARATGSSSWR